LRKTYVSGEHCGGVDAVVVSKKRVHYAFAVG